MDKMIQAANGEVSITNDGATILKQMNVLHPAAKMLVELSRAQDVAAGDGTTSVVVIAGALLEACEKLLQKGLHPTAISDSFQRCSDKAVQILTEMSTPIELSDRETLIKRLHIAQLQGGVAAEQPAGSHRRGCSVEGHRARQRGLRGSEEHQGYLQSGRHRRGY